MKVDEAQRARAVERRQDPEERFKQALQKQGPPPKAPPAATKPGASVAPGAARTIAIASLKQSVVDASKAVSIKTTTETLSRARAFAHAESDRLGDVRSELNQSREEKLNARAFELLRKELDREGAGSTRASPLHREGPMGQRQHEDSRDRGALGELEPVGARSSLASEAHPTEGTDPVTAASAIELVQRIEVLVKENRPALRLQVTDGAFAGEVEIVRLGRGEVALHVQGRQVPGSELEKLRGELAARGIRLTRIDS